MMKQKLLIFVVAMQGVLSFAEKTAVDLGRAVIHAPLRHTVSYTNANPLDPVQIRRVVTSCSCLRILSYPAEVAAGGSCGIELELTPDKTGRLEYNLMVQSAAGEARMFALRVEVEPSASAPSAAFPALPPRVVAVRDGTLYRTAAEIRAAAGAVFFADVRSPAEFEQCHIPGALNLPAMAVRTRGWLKSFPLVLVDGGWGDPALEDTVRGLRGAGFVSVHVLQGGLPGWRASGGATEGSMPGLPSLEEVSAAEYLRGRNFDDWVVVDLSAGAAGALPEGVSVRVDELPGRLGTLMGRRAGRVLITDADGRGYAEVRRALAGWNGAPVFYLRDGMQGVETELKRMAASADSRTVTVSSRPVASAVRGGVPGGAGPGRKPCGTCPH